MDHVISGDEMSCHHYEPTSEEQSMEWQHVNSSSKKKLTMQLSVGEVMSTVFWDRKKMILLDFVEPRQIINSDRYIMTLTKLKA